MSLRSNKALKLFAILLFSFEMIAPALISSVADQSTSQETKFSSNDRHFTTLVSSLLCEESSSEGERESKDQKSTISFIDFDFLETYSLLVNTEQQQHSSIESHRVGISQPALFTLFHTYLI